MQKLMGAAPAQPSFPPPVQTFFQHTVYYQAYMRAPWDGPPPSPARALHLDTPASMGISIMPKGHNTCVWLRLSSTELCGKSCLGDFCKVHLVLLRKGSCTEPCRNCGVGVTNKQHLCCSCGYKDEWRRATKATRREFARLATIELPI